MTQDEIQQGLRNFGLSKSETAVYRYVLEHGLSTPPEIALGTGIARTNTYNVLHALADRDLIHVQEKGKRKAYLARDPEALIAAEKDKQQALERLLPALRGMYVSQVNKPKIRYYDGFDEVKVFWQEMLNAKRIYGIASTSKLFTLSPGFFEKFGRDVGKKGITWRDIVSYESGRAAVQQTKQRMGENYRAKILPKEYEDLPTDILIWDNNIALVTTEDPVFATVLTNEHLAKTFIVMFEIMWAALGKEY